LVRWRGARWDWVPGGSSKWPGHAAMTLFVLCGVFLLASVAPGRAVGWVGGGCECARSRGRENTRAWAGLRGVRDKVLCVCVCGHDVATTPAQQRNVSSVLERCVGRHWPMSAPFTTCVLPNLHITSHQLRKLTQPQPITHTTRTHYPSARAAKTCLSSDETTGDPATGVTRPHWCVCATTTDSTPAHVAPTTG
jgi:hypothetical protein